MVKCRREEWSRNNGGLRGKYEGDGLRRNRRCAKRKQEFGTRTQKETKCVRMETSSEKKSEPRFWIKGVVQGVHHKHTIGSEDFC